MKNLIRSMREGIKFVVPLTALTMGAFTWLAIYGPLKPPMEDGDGTWFFYARVVLVYLGIQLILGSLKTSGSMSWIFLDLAASTIGLVVSGYALFQETQGIALLTDFQERVVWMIFLATAIDVIAILFGDLLRAILTNDYRAMK